MNSKLYENHVLKCFFGNTTITQSLLKNDYNLLILETLKMIIQIDQKINNHTKHNGDYKAKWVSSNDCLFTILSQGLNVSLLRNYSMEIHDVVKSLIVNNYVWLHFNRSCVIFSSRYSYLKYNFYQNNYVAEIVCWLIVFMYSCLNKQHWIFKL